MATKKRTSTKTSAKKPAIKAPRQLWAIIDDGQELIGSYTSLKAAKKDLFSDEHVVGPYILAERTRQD